MNLHKTEQRGYRLILGFITYRRLEMSRRIIHNEQNRENRNNHNENYTELYEKILMVNKMISDLVIESGGDSSSEVIHARGGYPLLGNRLDILDDEIAKKVDRIEARLRTQKIEPEDASERLLGLITGDGEINLLTIPQDNSVSMPKFEPDLRQDFQYLFGAFVDQSDFIPIELFDGAEVRQGGVTDKGTTDSLTRTHIEIKAKPMMDYYITIPTSDFLRIRTVSFWDDDIYLGNAAWDQLYRGLGFKTLSGTNKMIISFARTNTSERLTPSDTAGELVSIFELRYNPRNLITNINQGGITGGSRFTENDSRTRTEKIPVEPLTVCRVSVNESSNVVVRNISGYTIDDVGSFILPDGERKN